MNHPTSSLQAGTRVDDYEIIETLWATNSGFLYRARDLDRERDVLVQEFLPSILATRHWSGIHAMPLEGLQEEFDQGLTEFLREARILAQIHDPYVCRVYEYTETNATAYMVLDYEPGQTLKDHLAGRKSPLDEGEIRKLLVPLLKGLRVAHAADLLHRDIHPANIYLREVGPPVLIGFGSPTVAPRDDSEQHIESRIAPGYSPVEQYQSEGRFGPWSDLYALGATMYRCLSGATPVEATSRVTELAQDREDPLVPATELGISDYSSALLSAIDWMMEPMAASRPHSAGAVLGPLTEDRAAEAEPAAPPAFRKPGGGAATRPTGESRAPRPVARPAAEYRDHSKRPVLRAPDPGDRPGAEPPPVKDVYRTTGGKKRGGRGRVWPLLMVLAGVSLVAFFVLYEPPESPSNQVEALTAAEPVPTPAAADADPPPDLPETVNFGREQDDQRADAYRDLQERTTRIEEMLAAAEENLIRGRLVSPAGDNALAGYRSVLALDPDQTDARLGIGTIQTELVKAAEMAFEAGNIDESRRLLEQAAEVREESDRALALREEIERHVAEKARQEALARRAEQEREAARLRAEQERREQVQSLVRQADAALRAGNLTQPPGDNALAHYRRALRLEPENATAQQGIERIGRSYLDQASDALAKDELERAEGLLNTAAAILPDSESIPLLNKQLETRRQVVEQERLQARLDQEAREREARERKAREREREARRQQALAAQASAGPEIVDTTTSRDLEDGITAYYAGDYDIAYRLLQPLAEQGEPRAMFRLAMMYHHGRGVEQNVNRARTLIREALPEIRERVAASEAWAQADLASLYAEGIVLAENDSEAVRLYRLAAEQGYAGAQTNLGVMYANGEGVARNREDAVVWLERAAAQGDRIAQQNLQALGTDDADSGVSTR